jgi:hypothetical protein
VLQVMADEIAQGEGPKGASLPASGGELAQMAREVDLAFPNLKCLRCGNESFFLVGPESDSYRIIKKTPSFYKFDSDASAIEVLELVCQRCGMIERHSWKILKNAQKPIQTD